MELCAETLEDYLDARARSSLSAEDYQERMHIATQLIQAIHTIHCDHKLIHRDLSLRNVFIGRDGAIKIGDFGLATRRRHLIPQLASPTGLKPMEPLPEEDVNSFNLEEDVEKSPEDLSRSSDSVPSEDDEMTHGLGTRTFAAPEQMSNLPYDQHADIYSLGLILLALFSPTETLSERYEILCKCRVHNGPSFAFASKYPELGTLIARMTSEVPSQRPSIVEIKESTLFAGEKKGRDWEKMGFNGTKSLISIGANGKRKVKYLKLCGDNLLIYNRKGDEKAKFCYPLNECKIVPSSSTAATKCPPIRRYQSSRQCLKSTGPIDYAYKVAVEHPQLETLYMFLLSPPLCSQN